MGGHMTFEIQNMQYVTEKHFDHLASDVTDTFIERRHFFKDKLKIYELDVYFLSDSERWGPGTIRAYLKSFHFDKFTRDQLQTGGKYVSFCNIFKVCSMLSRTYELGVYIFLLKESKRTLKSWLIPYKKHVVMFYGHIAWFEC